MRPGEPLTAWASTYLSWAFLFVLALQLFSPKRLAEYKAPLVLADEMPPAASSGRWSSVAASASGVYWVFDIDSASIRTRNVAHSDGRKHSRDQQHGLGEYANEAPMNLTVTQGNTHLVWRFGPRDSSSDDHSAVGSATQGTAHLFSHALIVPATSDDRAGEEVPLSGRTDRDEPREQRTKKNSDETVHSIEPTTSPSAVSSGRRNFLLNAQLWWRSGNVATDAIHSIRLVGGRRNSVGASSPVSYVVIGMPQNMVGRSTAADLVKGNETLKRLAERLTRHDGLNVSQVTMLFAGVLRAMEITGPNRSSNDGTSRSPPPDAAVEAPRETRYGAPEMDASTCIWVGELNASRGAAASVSSESSDDPAEPYSSSGGAVTGLLYSTCGDTMRFSVTQDAYERTVTHWTAPLFFFGVVPLAAYFAFLLRQWGYMRNSRARTLRVSRAQLLLLCLWLSFYIFYAEVLWSTLPTQKKLINVGYTLALTACMVTLHVFALVSEEHRLANHLAPNRTSVFLLFFLGSSVANVVPALLRSRMFLPWVLLVSCVLFWAPQLFHVVRSGGKDGVLISYIGASTLLPLGVLLTLGCSPSDAIAPYPQPTFLVLCAAVLVAEATLLALVTRFGIVEILPRKLMPWRHRYSVRSEDIPKYRGLAEDPECSICGDTLLHSSSSTVGDVWVTPCGHLYHSACLSQWMEQRLECPLCRKALPEP